jgi:hypothetical protein
MADHERGRVKEGGVCWGRSMAWERGKRGSAAPWHGNVRGGGGGAAGSIREGGRRRVGVWPGGPARPAWLLGAKRPDGPAGHWAALEICTRRFRRNVRCLYYLFKMQPNALLIRQNFIMA